MERFLPNFFLLMIVLWFVAVYFTSNIAVEIENQERYTVRLQKLRGAVDVVFDQLKNSSNSTTTYLKKHKKLSIPTELEKYVDKDGFVSTGDIDDMWIRDSTAQIWPFRKSHYILAQKILAKQADYIKEDVYANSYRRKAKTSLTSYEKRLGRYGRVATRNYELDSGAYFIRLLCALRDTRFEDVVQLLVDTWIIEQHHEDKSPYRYTELSRNGLGTKTVYTGMTWTGFRPSDDKCIYHYLIPSNLFAVKVLRDVLKIFPNIIGASKLADEIELGVKSYGTWTDDKGVIRYCYEVDGMGGCNRMDDANLPSLLSIPYFDSSKFNDPIWKNTYDWVWSNNNPYFYKGTVADGIGSPHTPKNYIWPLSLITRGLVDPTKATVMIDMLKRTSTDGKLHESFDKDNFKKFTREDFSWPNMLVKELIV